MPKKTSTSMFIAHFIGRPGDTRDLAAHSIIDQYAGKVLSAGTMLPDGVRNINVIIPTTNMQPCKEALHKAGLETEDI